MKAFAWLRGGGAPVTISAFLLALLLLSALLAPVIAPYDYRQQNRQFPNCPPSPLRLRAPAQWSTSILYTHPYRLADATTRRYELLPDVDVPIRLLSGGRLFTTPAGGPKYFAEARPEPVPR